MDEVVNGLILFGAGAIASFINMMAGGGSILTIGALILVGVEPVVANGTNRIGVLFGTGSGALTYKAEKFTDLKTSLILGASAIPGAILGSIYSVKISNELFQRILAIVMILILVSMFIPTKKREETAEKLKKSWLIYPAMVFVGLYGGFIQVGVGFIIMAFLRHLMAYDLLRVNMHKVFIVVIYTIPVLVIFGISGKINWYYALIMSMGNILGSYISVKLALKKGEKMVKVVLVFAIVLMAIKFLLE
ncbi:MAG: sulfite exporter TauE/SafE family protein [Prolixibacteraceae bacterium]